MLKRPALKIFAATSLLLAVGLSIFGLRCDVDGFAGNLLASVVGVALSVFVAVTVVAWLERRRWRRVQSWALESVRTSLETLTRILAIDVPGLNESLTDSLARCRQVFEARHDAAAASLSAAGLDFDQELVGIPEIAQIPAAFEPLVQVVRGAAVPRLLAAIGPSTAAEALLELDARWHAWNESLRASRARIERLTRRAQLDGDLAGDARERRTREALDAVATSRQLGATTFDALATVARLHGCTASIAM